jgi:hypothetical protein
MSDTQKAPWERYDFATLPTLASGERMTREARDLEFCYAWSLEDIEVRDNQG